MRKETKYETPIAITKQGEIIVLHCIFEYNDGMKGATGSAQVPVTQAECDERNDIEYIKDCYDGGRLWKEEVKAGNTDKGLDDYLAGMVQAFEYEGKYFFLQDDSFNHMVPDELLAEHFPKAVTMECTGCGRMFGDEDRSDWQVLRPDLLKLVDKIEGRKRK